MFKNEKPFEIIVLGPPVSGKGTQTELIAKTFDIPHISTGQILHMIKSDTSNPLSAEVISYMDNGKLVPTELVNRLVADRIKQDDCKFGYAIDGFPRTLEQAQFMNTNADVDYVFLIKISDATIVERMSGRRVCKNGHAWHLKYSPPKIEGICDTCGEALFQRDDDKEDVVKSRLEIYHRETDAIIKFYADKGMLIEIDGETHIEGVFQQIVKKMVVDLRSKIGWK
ncbi:MAG: nucleoside monophosphate kinase [Patescibacteria group bacterium]|jgi:adenylate kinase